MISVSNAFALTQQHLLHLPTETVRLDNALGRVLRRAVYADRDFPPFDRVTMDGIALRLTNDVKIEPFTSFRVVGTQFAGQPPLTLTDPNTCLEVMTGAMLPAGANAVVRYEDVTITNGVATVNAAIQPGQAIHRQATDRRAGDELLPVGTRLEPTELAVAASVGQIELIVSALPRVALISTGDELVDVADQPLPYQIRRSNTYLLRAVLASLGIAATLHHIVDNEDILANKLAVLLAENDVLILSGGVSAGKADFVPGTLAKLGVQQQFHKVEQRPGKPLWFGTTPDKTVFGLPGNPVSTVLCAYRYVMPYLRASLGLLPEPARYAQLAKDFTFRPALTYFLPARLTTEPDGRLLAHPLPGSGSADFANLLDADGFLELPADHSNFDVGTAFRLWPTW